MGQVPIKSFVIKSHIKQSLAQSYDLPTSSRLQTNTHNILTIEMNFSVVERWFMENIYTFHCRSIAWDLDANEEQDPSLHIPLDWPERVIGDYKDWKYYVRLLSSNYLPQNSLPVSVAAE